MPSDFMNPAEASGLIAKLDHQMLFRAVQVIRRLQIKNREVDHLKRFGAALRRALPAYSNEVVLMLHSTSLASVVTLLVASIGLLGIKAVQVKMLPFDIKSEFQVVLDLP